MSHSALLDVTNLTLTVGPGGPPIVERASFQVNPSEIAAIVGESGSGKTMAVRAVLDLLPPPLLRQSGGILFQGQDMTTLNLSAMQAIRGAGIGMIFQEPMTSLNPALSIGKQLDEGLALHSGLTAKQRKERITTILERIGITDPEHRLGCYPHEFSGGMRQRIMIAGAMLLRPALIIADEPTTALDALVQKEVLDLLMDLCRENKTAVLLISHDLPLVARFAQKVFVMENGLVVEQGDTERILLAPRHPYTNRLLESLPRRHTQPPQPRSGHPIVKIEKLEITYSGQRRLFKKSLPTKAVDKVDLEIHPAEVVAVVGGSGSGKTTLARAVVRLLRPKGGRILFRGKDINQARGDTLHEYRLATQIVFQDPFSSLDPRLRIKDIVGEPLRLVHGIKKEERVEATLRDVGLDAGFLERFPHQLSGGQRQRVAIARAIVRRPAFIVADEPVSALDMTIQRQVLDLLRSLQKQYGFACLFISHDLSVVESLADWIVVMNHSRKETQSMRKNYEMLINGTSAKAHSEKTRTIHDPANGEPVAIVPEGDSADARIAIEAARKAFDRGPWRKASALDRGKLLFKIADGIRSKGKLLRELEVRNNGKPLAEAEFDVADAANCFEFYGGMATKIHGETMHVPAPSMSYTVREPIGVCAQIIPWNYPLLMAAWKLAPALAAGNTCILKPSELTPLAALELGEILMECDLPGGVVNIVTGPGAGLGEELSRHPMVDKVAFTGGTLTGRKIMLSASETIKKISLELGGKNPNIVFADCDLESAIDGALFGAFANQGQVCSAGAKLLVEEPIHRDLVDGMLRKIPRIKLGHGLNPGVKMGPLISAPHRRKVERYIELGKKEGAKLLCGGSRPGRSSGLKKMEVDNAHFLEPTIFDGVHAQMRIAREEIFGPVLTVQTFKTEDEAIALANDTEYGLAAGVWSKSIQKALRVIHQIRAGITWINTYHPTYNEMPWGGYKQSGIGRELGLYGIEEYLEVKQVNINLDEAPIAWY